MAVPKLPELLLKSIALFAAPIFAPPPMLPANEANVIPPEMLVPPNVAALSVIPPVALVTLTFIRVAVDKVAAIVTAVAELKEN